MRYNIVAASNNEDFGQKAKLAFYQSIKGAPEVPKVILPTGSTPEPFYAALRDDPFAPSFAYRQLDEYLGLKAGDIRLFSEWLGRDVLDPLGITNRMVFNSAADPHSEVQRIMSWCMQHGAAHTAIIGLGNNGHVGFNEPGSSFGSRVRVVDLTPETIAANQTYWKGQTVPTQAITLGIADLIEAENTILLVRGAAKADILYQALYGPVSPDVPASYLQCQKNLTIVADRAALARMPA